LATVASALPTEQDFKLLASDGDPADFFGFSVAISDDVAIIGAYGDDDHGAFSGSAYVYDATTGNQLFKLISDDGANGDLLGWSVAISGDIAVVGALNDNDNGSNSGSAYVFDMTTGNQLFKLLADDGAAGDYFGESVGISGTTAIIGAQEDGDNGYLSGSVYVFDVATGNQLFKLLADDGDTFDYFGKSVAISGTTAIVGAVGDADNGTDSGSAYIFGSVCLGDCDGSGTVDFNDLTAMQFVYGPANPGDPCDADESGTIDFNDLVEALFFFGPCP